MVDSQQSGKKIYEKKFKRIELLLSLFDFVDIEFVDQHQCLNRCVCVF